MAEIVLAAVLPVLFEKLASVGLSKLALSEGIRSQLKEWSMTLNKIQAVLFDAGQKQISSKAVKLWLHDLRELAYDIDDILDDLATEALHRKLTKESQASTSKVTKLIPTCFPSFSPTTFKYGCKMRGKLDDITKKLQKIAVDKISFGLNENVGKSNKKNRRPETSSLVDESSIVGRQGDKEALLNKLLVEEACNQNVGIVPIVGLGGIGKTTLAGILYNDKKVKDHFDMNDLATFVAGDFFFRLDDMNADIRNEALDKYRHLSFIRPEYGVYRKFKAFQRGKCLTTFLAVSVGLKGWERFYLSSKVLDELLAQLPLLRVLSLSYYQISEIPESIGSLKHLRYLNLSRTRITHLPEQVGNLYNLQTLLVSGCDELTKLPNSFVKLINLRHFDMNGTGIKKMPLGIGELKSLRTLSKVFIKGVNGFALTDLKGLRDLCGRLSIEGLDKVKNAMEVKEAGLLPKMGLNDLEMEWSDVFDGSRKETLEKEVLEALKPHNDKLRKLGIKFYGGKEFPRWVGDPSFLHLAHVRISGCKKCTCLPPFGQLPLLKELFVEGMDGVKVVGSELLGTGNSSSGVVAFPSLEILSFVKMNGWELWSVNNGDGDGVFPCLRKLSIQDCPSLVEASVGALPSLRVLDIDGCRDVVLRSVLCAASPVAELRMGRISGLIQLDGGVMEYLRAVEDLKIVRCDEVRYLWESEAEACKILVNLRRLGVIFCKNLVGLGEKEEVKCGSSLPSLRELDIQDCGKLERLKLPSTLKNLSISRCKKLMVEEELGVVGEEGRMILNSSMTSLDCPNLKWLPDMRCFINLTSLWIDNCEGIESFPVPERGYGVLPPGLTRLSIMDCKNLKWLPDMRCCNNLTSLWISNCEGIESFPVPERGYGVLPPGLTQLSIMRCKNLKSFPDDEFPTLTSLLITNCPSLGDPLPRGIWPPNLIRLEIGGLKKPVSEWGPQSFPASLVRLSLEGFSEDLGSSSPLSLVLPSSLTDLSLVGFKELESVSTGLQHLTSLQSLSIRLCPKIRDLPKTLLPSLSSLFIYGCPKLKERCSSSKSRDSYWPLISDIPCVEFM